MRILYIDIDSLRPDHLGCYGYHRQTSPNIDKLAAEGVRFTNCYAPDAPCLPSRTALFSGRHGFHTGVINHGGVASQPFIEGPERGFRDRFGATAWPAILREQTNRSVIISPFGERHCAWWWYAGASEIYNTKGGGQESAHEVSPVAIDWIKRNGKEDNWFMHLNVWDPHTPYRTPEKCKELFKDDPLPSWYSQEVLDDHRSRPGPHSAREVNEFEPVKGPGQWLEHYDQQPDEIKNMDDARMMFDGYDRGVHYADEHVGYILKALEEEGVLDETVIIISGDHGENLGELNIYGDHQTADSITCRVPLIIRWPGVTDSQQGRVDESLIYNFDMAATVTELVGSEVPDIWDGQSFADNFKAGKDADLHDTVVVSQGAWTCQRGVRWDDYILIHSYHDGYHGFPDDMLFNIKEDPHEQHNLAEERPDLLAEGHRRLQGWLTEMMRTATHPQDPMMTVLSEGGAFHSRAQLPRYLKRLRATDRHEWADYFEEKYAHEL